jgi:uroporphyrinogen-III synthase
MAPLKVLITRPQPQADALQAMLANQQIFAIAQPLFRIVNKTDTAALQEMFQANQAAYNSVVFVSAAAVEAAQLTLPLAMWPVQQFIAVGQKTKATLSQYYQGNILAPKLENSEGLLQLPELQQVENKHFIIVRGDGGRELIAQTLIERKAKVSYYEAYERQWLDYSKSNTLDQWQKLQINCIVVTSNALLENMVQRLANQGEFWQKQCLWIVVSERSLEQAKTLGLQQVINAGSAKNEVLSELISNYGK